MFQHGEIFRLWKSNRSLRTAALLILFFSFILAQRTLAVASDFYISTTGSDSNACTQGAPCATFNHVDGLVQPGDSVHVMSGTYSLNSSTCITTAKSGTSSAPITWQSDVHGAAHINGNGACLYMWHATGSYQKILGFDFTGVQNNSNPPSAVILTVGTNGNHEIAYDTFHDLTGYFGAAIITQPGEAEPSGYSGAPCSVHDNIFSNIAVGFNSTKDHYSIYNTCGTNTTIYNNLIYNEGSIAIQCWHSANNVHIYNNTIDHSYWGILVGTGDQGAVNGAYFDVTNNIVSNTTDSIVAEDQAPGLISSSSIFRNNLLFNNVTDWYYNNNGTTKSITSSFTVSGTISGKDPLFVVQSSGNYRLQSGSPAIGAGLETSFTPVLDLAGATRPNPPSIGAYESGTPVVIPPPGNINTIAGNGTQGYSGDNGAATSAELNNSPDVAVDSAGNIYIADASNNVIRKVTASTGIITTVAGDGTAGYSGDGGAATSAKLNFPFGLAVDSSGNIYIADANNQAIRRVTASTGIITTFAGTGSAGYTGDGGQATSAEIDEPLRVAVDSTGNIYFSDPNHNVIRKVTVSTGVITTVAGNGTVGYTGDGGLATSAEINNPYGVAVDGSGNIYIADRANSVIRKVTASTGIITTVAGNGTQGYSGDGGPATSAAIYGPPGVAADSAGNIYIADANNDAIRKVTVSTGIITTVAGNHSDGFSGDGGPATNASLATPAGVAVDGNGNIYIADKFNNRIRVVGGSGGGGGSNNQLSNFDDITTGWLQCTGPSCAGGTGTPTSTSQTFGNTTPALDSGSMMLSESGPSFSNNAWYYNTGKDDSNTIFTVDLEFSVPSTAQLETLEFDQFQYLLAGNGGATANTRFYFGTQCVTGGNWDVWDEGLTKWVDTGVVCNYTVSATAFNRLTIKVHRVAGDTSCTSGMPCQFYDSITLNGTVVVSNMKTSAGPLPSGWSEQTGVFLQMGTNGTCSSGCTIKEFIDQATFSY